ncbi:MAG: phage major capsid protein [Opitutales bacterium]|nr:phage major capsid protein [Opitutales bacterium]
MNKEQERDECLARMRALLEKAKSEGRDLTEDEQKQFDADNARAEELTQQIEADNKRAADLEAAEKRAREIRARAVNPVPAGTFGGGQNLRDLKKFSFARSIKSMLSGSKVDGVEAEVFAEGQTEAQRRGLNYSPQAKVIPMEALRALANAKLNTRAAVSVSGTEGATVPVDVYQNIWDMFRSRLVLPRLGATVFENLTGNLKVPEQITAGGDLGFIGETASATELSPEIAKAELSPHRVSAYTNITTQLVMQSTPDVEAFTTRNLIESALRVVENNVFNGAADAAVVGIPNITGVNYSNVAEAGKPTWQEVLALIAGVMDKNAPVDAMGFALDGTLATTLMSTPKAPVVEGATVVADQFIMSEFVNQDGLKSIAGLKAALTSLCSGNLIFGVWERLFIGMWGGIGILVNPYSQAKTGQIELVVETFADAKVGNPANFSVLSMEEAAASGGSDGGNGGAEGGTQ